MALPVQRLSHQTLCSRGVAAALHQNIENEAVLIDGPPAPVFLSANSHDDLARYPLSPSLLSERQRLTLTKRLPISQPTFALSGARQ
jgi:hypothetical protein